MIMKNKKIIYILMSLLFISLLLIFFNSKEEGNSNNNTIIQNMNFENTINSNEVEKNFKILMSQMIQNVFT